MKRFSRYPHWLDMVAAVSPLNYLPKEHAYAFDVIAPFAIYAALARDRRLVMTWRSWSTALAQDPTRPVECLRCQLRARLTPDDAAAGRVYDAICADIGAMLKPDYVDRRVWGTFIETLDLTGVAPEAGRDDWQPPF